MFISGLEINLQGTKFVNADSLLINLNCGASAPAPTPPADTDTDSDTNQKSSLPPLAMDF